MISKITALFLAILVANPFCCCLGRIGAGDASPADGGHSCCAQQQQQDRSDAPVRDGGGVPCGCDGSREQQLLAQAHSGKWGATEWTLVAETEWTVVREELSEFSSGGNLFWVLQRTHAPPGRALSQVHCVYRL